jgi:hypothetical protein
MKNIIFIILISWSLLWCSAITQDEKITDNNIKPTCIKQDIIDNLYNISVKELQNICNYNDISLKSVQSEDERMRLQYLYEFLTSHKETWLYIIRNFDIESFSYIDKLKLYYILWREYGMNDDEAENIVGEINENHKGLYMPTGDYVFWEFMLTIDYDRYNEPEIDSIPESRIVVWAREYLRYDHIKLLDIILSTEPERLTNIYIISSIQPAYKTLQDSRSKELYLNMFRKFYKLDEVQNWTFKKEIERLFEDAGEEL